MRLPGDSSGVGKGRRVGLKRAQENSCFLGEAYVHHFDCDDSFTGTFIGHNLQTVSLNMCSLLYFNKAVITKERTCMFKSWRRI